MIYSLRIALKKKLTFRTQVRGVPAKHFSPSNDRVRAFYCFVKVTGCFSALTAQKNAQKHAPPGKATGPKTTRYKSEGSEVKTWKKNAKLAREVGVKIVNSASWRKKHIRFPRLKKYAKMSRK